MLYIREKDGEVTSAAVCDDCNQGVAWDGNVSLSQMKTLLRRYKGWKVGKRHICSECKQKPATEGVN